MNRADNAFERAAGKLDELAAETEEKGGVAAKLAPALADDADFLRTMEPSKVAQRVRGGRPSETASKSRHTPSTKGSRRSAGAGRLAALAPAGAAFALGVLVAKLIDWRSYAEPRR
jgi:hypothetical protein